MLAQITPPLLDRYDNSPAVHEGEVYVGTSIPGIFQAVDAKTGAGIFQLPTGSPIFGSMAVAEHTLYMGNFAGTLAAIDLNTHKSVWAFETDGAKENAQKLTNPDGSIKFEAIFPSPNPFYDDMVVAISKLFSMGTILSSPAVVGESVYFGGTDGNVYALKCTLTSV